MAAVRLVGKEGNRLEEAATGEVTDPEAMLIEYGDDAREVMVLPIVRSLTVARNPEQSRDQQQAQVSAEPDKTDGK